MGLLENFNTKHNYIITPPAPIEVGSCRPEAKKQKGVCVIIGTHPDWREDLEAVLAVHPKVDVCGINEAVRLIKCKHLVTAHRDKISDFIELHKKYHKGKYLPLIHLQDIPVRDDSDRPKAKHHLWKIKTMAGSAPFAAAAMVLLGYEEVIMCGCPMTGGGGYAFEDTHKGDRFDPRIGYVNGDHNMLKSWHIAMVKFKKQFPKVANKISSMSGKTGEIFGGLDG